MILLVYATEDLQSWRLAGRALVAAGRPAGIEFRPHVVYNARTAQYVMWFEDRPDAITSSVYLSGTLATNKLRVAAHNQMPCTWSDGTWRHKAVKLASELNNFPITVNAQCPNDYCFAYDARLCNATTWSCKSGHCCNFGGQSPSLKSPITNHLLHGIV